MIQTKFLVINMYGASERMNDNPSMKKQTKEPRGRTETETGKQTTATSNNNDNSFDKNNEELHTPRSTKNRKSRCSCCVCVQSNTI